MKAINLMVVALSAILLTNNINAQAEKKPFSITIGSITITGTYSEGYLYTHTVNGTSILWGLVSWGGSQIVDCRPGSAVCKIETILSVGFKGFRTNEKGQKGLEKSQATGDAYPVLITTDGKNITFAVDIEQVNSAQKGLYQANEWKLERGFVLAPNVVRELNLYNGPEEKGFLIPAGTYPLRRDGNIGYWTWERPE